MSLWFASGDARWYRLGTYKIQDGYIVHKSAISLKQHTTLSSVPTRGVQRHGRLEGCFFENSHHDNVLPSGTRWHPAVRGDTIKCSAPILGSPVQSATGGSCACVIWSLSRWRTKAIKAQRTGDPMRTITPIWTKRDASTHDNKRERDWCVKWIPHTCHGWHGTNSLSIRSVFVASRHHWIECTNVLISNIIQPMMRIAKRPTTDHHNHHHFIIKICK